MKILFAITFLAMTQAFGMEPLIQGMKYAKSSHLFKHQMTKRFYGHYPSSEVRHQLSVRLNTMKNEHLPALYEISDRLGDDVRGICKNLEDCTDTGADISAIYQAVWNTDSNIIDNLHRSKKQYTSEQRKAIKFQRDMINFFYQNIADGNVEGKY